MKKNLLNAAKNLRDRMGCSLTHFEDAKEILDEGFALLRPEPALFAEICEENDLCPETTELAFMCLEPRFAKGKTYSTPHMHSQRSLTAVVPLTSGGTFLPRKEGGGQLMLQEGECFIEGEKPHAFGMVGNLPFIAALAVGSVNGETKPITKGDGEYETSMLKIKEVKGTKLNYFEV